MDALSRRRIRLRSRLAVATLCAGFASLLTSPLHAAGTAGTSFWLAFPTNGALGDLSLQILGGSGTTGSVEIPGLAFEAPYSISESGLATVAVPIGAMLSSSDGVEARGVHVTASRAVVVHGVHLHPDSADTFLALPISALGLAYETISYAPADFSTSQLAVVATTDGTQVTVTPTAAIGARQAGASYEVALDAGQAYQGQSAGDLSGTQIVANHPIAVLSGNPWANVPAGAGFADHLVEQLLPTTAWGTDVFAISSALRTAAERLRIQATEPDTQVTVTPGSGMMLGAGSWVEISFDVPVRIEANRPVAVSHFSGGSSGDGIGDPFLLMTPAVEHFALCYLFATADSGAVFPDNFVNLVVPSAVVDQVRLDGSPLPAEGFAAIGTSEFSFQRLAIEPGAHRLSAPQAFGASVYGFGADVAYASPAGGASPPFPAGLDACQEIPEPAALGLGLASIATLACKRMCARGQRQPRTQSRSPSDASTAPSRPVHHTA